MKYKEDPLFDDEGVRDVKLRALEYKWNTEFIYINTIILI